MSTFCPLQTNVSSVEAARFATGADCNVRDSSGVSLHQSTPVSCKPFLATFYTVFFVVYIANICSISAIAGSSVGSGFIMSLQYAY